MDNESSNSDAYSGYDSSSNQTSPDKAFNQLFVMANRFNNLIARPGERPATTGRKMGRPKIEEEEDDILSPVISEPPLEYDGFEQLPKKYEIRGTAKEVQRYPQIKPRSFSTPKKESERIEEEPATLGKKTEKEPVATEEECKSPHEEPSATKPEYEGEETEFSDSDNEVEVPGIWNVVVHKGILKKENPLVNVCQFVMFSNSPRMYIRVEELEARLSGDYEARYKNDRRLENGVSIQLITSRSITTFFRRVTIKSRFTSGI
ncbi:hypothetical protein GALMADRAFT_1264490 [Galerina marginata CBS 339.88]|uniref:Uncharacterized protein n=1 Tax=Galerina marginata (strain CBS 339.88) TaxID=685588 RepID=A0A067T8L5_GALM3|nr:hypothetical protein GALMADRAFT_1264490 [Galerina marginata CBS 339.88]